MAQKILLVGGGLSGVCVASELIKRGVDLTLIDSGINHSSRVAAGMINPLVFRRMTKSWRLDDFLPFLFEFYRDLEQKSAARFFHELQIRRIFSSEQEREFWLKKQDKMEFSSYMHELTSEDLNYDRVPTPFGSGRVKGSCYVDTSAFLPAMRAYLSTQLNWREELFNFQELDASTYRGEQFDNIIFCEGYLGKNNPFFQDLPLNQTKGETLIIKAQSLPEDESVNRKCFVLPLGEQHFKIGSTYVWNTNDTQLTEAGKETMLENLSVLTDEKVEVIAQEAGVRPTTFDRRPLIGPHESISNYLIFNGLGTKGYMIAPLLAKEFVDALLGNQVFDPELSPYRKTS